MRQRLDKEARVRHREPLQINVAPKRPITCPKCGLPFIPAHSKQIECSRDHESLRRERERLDLEDEIRSMFE